MKRRDFLAASAASGLALLGAGTSRADESKSPKALLELRLYTFATEAKRDAFATFLAQTAIPAFARAGVGPVGIFTMQKEDNPKEKLPDLPALYILLPHKSMDSVLQLTSRLDADEEYQKAGTAILNVPQKDPSFTRYESSLLLAFDQFPQVQVPTTADTRLLQLRIYESHNAERARKKIQMFNDGGEIAVFARCGMTAVFFGQAIVGSKLPNLTYMLSFPNQEAKDKAWATFQKDPDWQKLKGAEEYKDTVCHITNLVLKPVAGSQI